MGRAFEFRKARKMKRWSNMAKTFTRIGREIIIAVKDLGPDPISNSKLRAIIQNAKAANMPKENIERAIKKASEKSTEDFKEVLLEGYAPHGIAILVEAATDNNNRTVANIRSYFNKCDGNLATSGSVDFLFKHLCFFQIKDEGLDIEELELDLIDFGAIDLSKSESEISITANFQNFGSIQKELEKRKLEITSSDFEREAINLKDLDEEKIKKVLEKNKYYSKKHVGLFRLFRHRHLPRSVNKNKTIAIEPHLKLLNPRYKCAFNTKRLVNYFNEGLETVKTPRQFFLFDHCIYNFQINDHGFINAKHSHRSIYDIYKLDCKKNVTIKNTTKDIYVKHFFMTIEKFNIFDLQIPYSFWSLCHDKCLRVLITLYSKLIFNNKFFVLILLPCNKSLRKRALNKIKCHYSNKSLLNYTYRWLIG